MSPASKPPQAPPPRQTGEGKSISPGGEERAIKLRLQSGRCSPFNQNPYEGSCLSKTKKGRFDGCRGCDGDGRWSCQGHHHADLQEGRARRLASAANPSRPSSPSSMASPWTASWAPCRKVR